MTTDTTAPAADDLREAIRLAIAGPCSRDPDTYLALIAPRLAAAREEGRREGIKQAAGVASRDRGMTQYGTMDFGPNVAGRIATAIRALADAPRTAEREGG